MQSQTETHTKCLHSHYLLRNLKTGNEEAVQMSVTALKEDDLYHFECCSSDFAQEQHQ